jgi:hypothetical protein
MTGNRISIGNAEDFAHGPTRGWFIGNFLDPSAGPRFTDHVEVKWSVHPEGDHRPDIAPGADTVTLAILISGAFEQIFPGQHPGRMPMERPGDFALYGPGVPHTWRALADSVMLTVRWKSPTPSHGSSYEETR